MANDASKNLAVARFGFAAQDAELIIAGERQRVSVRQRSATGSGDIANTFGLDQPYRLVFVRCHFAGTAGTAPLLITLDSNLGSAYDTKLYTVTLAGAGSDVHLRITDGELGEPSPWTFAAADRLQISWTNPDSGNITWGLEVGLALAS